MAPNFLGQVRLATAAKHCPGAHPPSSSPPLPTPCDYTAGIQSRTQAACRRGAMPLSARTNLAELADLALQFRLRRRAQVCRPYLPGVYAHACVCETAGSTSNCSYTLSVGLSFVSWSVRSSSASTHRPAVSHLLDLALLGGDASEPRPAWSSRSTPPAIPTTSYQLSLRSSSLELAPIFGT